MLSKFSLKYVYYHGIADSVHVCDALSAYEMEIVDMETILFITTILLPQEHHGCIIPVLSVF